MPQHPAEETAPDNIFDKVAKESSDSTASDHPLHKENEQPVKQAASAQDHKGLGPQISESKTYSLSYSCSFVLTKVPLDMPEAQSKDELKQKAAQMNVQSSE
jgi:hypothetical protein